MPTPSPLPLLSLLASLPLCLAACTAGGQGSTEGAQGSTLALADVLEVSATGSAGDWTFAVTVQSQETGCEQYADWWEVVGSDEALVYRRVLGHSHPDEQPFTRSGGPVAVGADEEVVVRAHMNPGGYGGAALRGSVAAGFQTAPELDASFAPGLESITPQPEDCAF